MKTFWQLTQLEKKAAIAAAEQEIITLLQQGFLADDGDYTTNNIRVLANMAAEGSEYSDTGLALKEVHQ